MKITLSTLCAAVLAMSPFVASPALSMAAPLPAVFNMGPQSSVFDDLVDVQNFRRQQHPRRGANRHARQRHRYHNPPRPTRPHRPSQSQSRGPDLGSAIVGAIIGGVIVNQFHQPRAQQPRMQHGSFLSQNHLNWCHNRWRSYRLSDNSYQPYNGPRRICVSPYGPN